MRIAVAIDGSPMSANVLDMAHRVALLDEEATFTVMNVFTEGFLRRAR